METTNELRRGNLVKVGGKMYQVFSLDSCFVGLSEVGKDELLFDTDVKNVEGVELDGLMLIEWFGFLKFASGNYYHEGDMFELDKMLWVDGCERAIKIEYAHRLQNIFREHVNKELEIKI